MEQGKNTLDRIEEIKDCYQVDPKVAERAIMQIEAEKAQKKVSKKKGFFKWVPALACALVAIIAVSTYFALKPAPPTAPTVIYYDDKAVTVEQCLDIQTTVSENDFTVKYFTQSSVQNSLGIVTETNKIGYIYQNFVDGWEDIDLYVKVLKNSEFNFENKFNGCNANYVYNGNVNVKYVQNTKEDSFGSPINVVKAKFSYQGNEYFMAVEYYLGEVTEIIAKYLNTLLA